MSCTTFVAACGAGQTPIAPAGPQRPDAIDLELPAEARRAVIRETAVFQDLEITFAPLGPRVGEAPCHETVAIGVSGGLTLTSLGAGVVATVAAADLAALAARAVSAAVIADLRAGERCRDGTGVSEQVRVGVGPGLHVASELCTGGAENTPAQALAFAVRAIARASHPGTCLAIPAGAGRTDAGGPAAVFDEAVSFTGNFVLGRQQDPCSPDDCVYEVIRLERERSAGSGSGTVAALHIHPTLGQRNWHGITDLAPLAPRAAAPDVIAEVRKAAPCPPVAALNETVTYQIGPRLFVRSEISGCATGPLADLRAAARAFIDRLAASSH